MNSHEIKEQKTLIKIVLAPKDVKISADEPFEKYVAQVVLKRYKGKIIKKGMEISIPVFGHTIPFVVYKTVPEEGGVLVETTTIEVLGKRPYDALFAVLSLRSVSPQLAQIMEKYPEVKSDIFKIIERLIMSKAERDLLKELKEGQIIEVEYMAEPLASIRVEALFPPGTAIGKNTVIIWKSQ